MGNWKNVSYATAHREKCSECGFIYSHPFPFCPNCGDKKANGKQEKYNEGCMEEGD